MSRASLANVDPSDLTAPVEAGGPEPDATSGADRRAHPRHTLAEIPFVSKVRLKYGPAVTLVDLSCGGAQIETTNFRLQPGSAVVLELTGPEGDLAVPAQVLRCQLANLLPEPVYRGALVFRQPLDLKALAPETALPDAAKELNPALEQARLRQALRRLVLVPEAGAPEAGLAALNQAIDTSLATLDSAAGRRCGSPLSAELAGLFRAVAGALEQGITPKALVLAIEEHLRRIVPARAIRIADAATFMQLPGSEAFFFSLPQLAPDMPALRIAVEFPEGCEPQELHLQIVKSAVPLLSLAGELGRRNGPDRPLEVRPVEKLPAGWSRIVVRYNSGQLLKGFTQHFLPTKGFVNVNSEPVASPDKKLAVPFTDLKAIFFVKDHVGNPGYAETKTLDPAARGRRVSVTFRDGEEIVGTTVNYNSSAPGFFVQPADPDSNNERIFVVAQAMRGLKFI
ncbi:MAG: PilZ domain-containing protein [Vicinamibacterales bacterium]